MQTQEHITEAIALAGGASVVARHFKVTPWAVSKWIAALPPHRVIALAELTRWRKPPHELCPELYPHPFDGLPDSLRALRDALDEDGEGSLPLLRDSTDDVIEHLPTEGGERP